MRPALRSILKEEGLADEAPSPHIPQMEPPEGHVAGSHPGSVCLPAVFSLLLSLLLVPQQMALLAASIEILIARGSSHTVGLVPTPISKQHVMHRREQAG